MHLHVQSHKLVLFEEALLVFEARDPNTEWYTKAAAAIQNAIQCYWAIYDEKKRGTIQTSLDHFFKKVDRIESSKKPEPMPSTSGVSEFAACPHLLLLMILQLYHLPPPFPPPVSNSSCLFTRCQPCMPAVVLYYFTFQGTVRLKMFSLFFVFVFYVCIICVKSIINLL